MTIDPVRPARPRQVTVAAWLQLAVVALFLGGVGLVIAYVVHLDHVISSVAARMPSADPDEVASLRSGNYVGLLVVGVPLLLAAIWFAATLWPVRRGSNVGRILVFVGGGGILLLGLTQVCGGFVPFGLIDILIGDGAIIDDPGPVEGGRSFAEEVYGRGDTFGDAAAAGGAVGALLVFGLMLAVVLLLALPPANQYFVPRAALPAGLPMMQFAGYAGVPVAHPAGVPVAHPAGVPVAHPVGAPVVFPAGAPAGFHGAPWPYMICPDPSAHFPAVPASPPASAEAAGPDPSAQSSSESADPSVVDAREDAGPGESSEQGQAR
ncbi:hypothetical protein [Dactylosporangium salmoneum]|uniref:Uncharacterized protein n=1 Tax=Dactylosporangium salmoneum TaxID=53361 RepID=A0ABP5S9B2_9ACTN